MATHRRVARPNSQESRHGHRKTEGVVYKTAEMSEQGTLAGSNPASPHIRNFLNFGAGLILGCISVAIWNYSKLLYYTVFIVQAVIIYILINMSDLNG
jgi:hypothetical protein